MNSIIAKQVESIIDPTLPLFSNLSNASAVLNTLEGLNWAGFYLVDGDHLVLGPFQGEVACARIPYGKGVCGGAWQKQETIIVDDVLSFPGHIACSSASRSEIVTPIFKEGRVVAVIDMDSPRYSRFGESEKQTLEEVAQILAKLFAKLC